MVSRITEGEIEQMLRAELDIKELRITDLKGGNHWQVELIASDFNGMPRVKREQKIQKILAGPLADESIHALVIRAKATDE
jgi:stress-induced morphogen